MAAEDGLRRQEIQSSLKSIVDTSENWLARLRKRESRVRLASSFLTFIIALLATLILGVITTVIASGRLAIPPVEVIAAVGGVALLAALMSSFVTYFLLKRRHEAELKEISQLITQMKSRFAQPSASASEGIADDALSLADRILSLLPGIVRRRNQDALLFGIVAFILGSIVGRDPAVGIIVGVIVWVYFRYETGKSYDRELAKIEEQKKIFEQRKKDFLETL